MSGYWLMTMTLFLPIDDGRSAALESYATETPDEFREQYRTMLKQTGRGTDADPEWAVPRLVGMYNAAPHVEGLSHSTKKRIRSGLKNRLERMHTRLAQDLRKGRTSRRSGGLNGPAEERSARQLIALIQDTISPSSWDVNGGNSVIRFYSPLNVLVIRASTRNHHEIGTVLGQLRK